MSEPTQRTATPPAALARAEEIVTRYAGGRIKTTGLYLALFGCGHDCLQLPPSIETPFEVATAAHAVWSRAVVGDYSAASAEACRALFERTLAELVAALAAATTTRTGEAA